MQNRNRSLPATEAELRAKYPDVDDVVLKMCVAQKVSLAGSADLIIQIQQIQIQARDHELATAEFATKKKPGIAPTASAPAEMASTIRGTPAGGSASERLEAAIAPFVANGMPREKAAARVLRSDEELRDDLLREATLRN